MYNFEVALAFASLKTTEALAYAKMIMDGTNPYGKFNWFQDFDLSKLPEEEEVEELKNYDVALALATAGRMDEAYFVVKEIDIHKKLDLSDFQKLDWSEDIKSLIDNATEKYKTFAIEREKSFDFKDKPKIKNKRIEYPEPADNSFLLKDS